jgi:hypothetical protein
MIKFVSALVFALAAGFTSLTNATVILSSSGLVAPDQLVTFSAPSLDPDSVVTNQYAAQGLTFSSLSGGVVRANSCGVGAFNGEAGMAGDTLGTYGPGCVNQGGVNDAFSMKFASDVSAASFSFRSGSYNFGNTIAAFNNGVLMAKYDFASNSHVSSIMQFSNFIFDELRFTEGSGNSNYFVFDNVAYVNANAVPEPASLALFGLGLAGLGAMRRKANKTA